MPDPELPDEVRFVRTTPRFTQETVPSGLLAAHEVAESNWAVLKVVTGELTFRFETGDDEARRLGAGEEQVIPPSTPHHLTVDSAVSFELDFYTSRDTPGERDPR